MQHDDEKESFAFTEVRLISIGRGGATCRRDDGRLPAIGSFCTRLRSAVLLR